MAPRLTPGREFGAKRMDSAPRSTRYKVAETRESGWPLFRLRARNFGVQAGAIQPAALHAESTADGCHPV